MKEALHYIKLRDQKVQCTLCPHECIIRAEKAGICKTRGNIDGKLYLLVYGNPVALHSDPIEKKPLYHFYPGSRIYSIGTLGCNMKCFYCQNCEISQASPPFADEMTHSPAEIVDLAKNSPRNIGIAFTYNEPVVFFEYMLDIAKLANKSGLKTVMVSNGYINSDPLRELLAYVDAFNIDLKAFNNNYYQKYTKSTLEPVLQTIRAIYQEGKHLEITHLLIPGLNDDIYEFGNMLGWLRDETNEKTVLHLSRYFPHYKSNLPPTPVEKLLEMYNAANECFNYVYIGNYQNNVGMNTYCPSCSELSIKRMGYNINTLGIDEKGFCIHCGESVIYHI